MGKTGYSAFNARAETIDVRSAFRAAWRAGGRCLVIADGYYEWRTGDKQPFAVASRADDLCRSVGLLALTRLQHG